MTAQELKQDGFVDSFIPCFGNLIKFENDTITGYNEKSDGTVVICKIFKAENEYALNSIKKWKKENVSNKKKLLASTEKGLTSFHGRWFKINEGEVKMETL